LLISAFMNLLSGTAKQGFFRQVRKSDLNVVA